MSLYIEKLDIHSFRGVSSLQLNNLAAVNILTGDNNCGRTSVLEIIRSYENPEDLRVWSGILRREGYIPGFSRLFSYYDGFYDLFNINEKRKRVEYTIETCKENVNNTENVLLEATEGTEELTLSEYSELTGRKYLEDPEEELSESTIPVQKIDMRAIINGKILSSTTIADGQLRNIYRKGTIPEEREGSNIVYISPSKHT